MIQIRGGDGFLVAGEFDGMFTQRAVGVGQRRSAPIAHHRVDKGIRCFRSFKLVRDLSTEVVGVGLCSVGAV